MSTLSSWIKATRPKTLIASMSPILIGSSFAYQKGYFNFWIFALTLLCGLGIQISTNVANDLFDFLKGADTAERKGPLRVTQSGLLSVAQVKMGTGLILFATALLGSCLSLRGGISVVCLLVLALLLAVGYTAGPFPLAYLGIAEFFILIFFGPVATGYTYYLQTLEFAPLPFLVGLSPGLISCSLLVVNNLRDISEDRKADKKTLVVRFGKTFGRIEFSLCLCLSIILPFVFLPIPNLWLLLCAVPTLLMILSLFKISSPQEYFPLFSYTGKLQALFTLIFCTGVLF